MPKLVSTKPVHNTVWLAARALAYRQADHVIAISDDVRQRLCSITLLPDTQVSVIENPAYTDDSVTMGDETPDHPWFNDDIPIVVGVGRLTGYKNFDILIRAVSQIAARRDIRLLILGKGGLRAELESLVKNLNAQEFIALPGFVDNPFAYYKSADIFAHAAKFEAFGNVLVEALAMGTPVVATNCPGGPPSILGHGKWGRLVPIGDPDAMAKAIEVTLDEPTDAERLKSRAQDFNVDTVADEYLSVLLPD